MTDWVSTKIKAGVKADAKELDATFTEIMQAGIDAIEGRDPGQKRQAVSLSEDDIQHIINEIGATADGEGRVDDDASAREVVRQMDYAMLATKVADELEGRMA